MALQIRRNNSGVAKVPTELEEGEIVVDLVTGVLYVGKGIEYDEDDDGNDVITDLGHFAFHSATTLTPIFEAPTGGVDFEVTENHSGAIIRANGATISFADSLPRGFTVEVIGPAVIDTPTLLSVDQLITIKPAGSGKITHLGSRQFWLRGDLQEVIPPLSVSLDLSGSGAVMQYRVAVEGTGDPLTVDWGDGTIEVLDSTTTHTYASPGNYQVVFTGGAGRNIGIGHPAIKHLETFGNIEAAGVRIGDGGLDPNHIASEIETIPRVLPPSITSTANMFKGIHNFNLPEVSDWDVTNVVDFQHMFCRCHVFNQDLSSWNTANATNMSTMFNSARKFNQDISMWCVENIATKPGSFDNDTPEWTDKASKQPLWGVSCD